MGITLDETTCREDILALFAILLGDEHGQDLEKLDNEVASETTRFLLACNATARS